MIVTVAVTDLTTRQTKRLAEFLANLNVQRVAQGKAPFPTVDAYAADYMQEWLTGNIRTFDLVDGDMVREAYINANNTTQAAVKTTLSLP